MLRYLFASFTVLLALTACVAPPTSRQYAPQSKGYAERYADLLEADEVILRGDYQYVVTQRGDTYIRRTYYPETRTLTNYAEYKDAALQVAHGDAKEWYDNGTLRTQTTSVDGALHGPYTRFFANGQPETSGRYEAGQPVGEWTEYIFVDSTETIVTTIPYRDGKRHGTATSLMASGEVYRVTEYEHGEIVSQDLRGSLRWPVMSACRQISDPEDQKSCSNRVLLEHVYGTLLYPVRARERDVQGTAIVSFVVESDGSVRDIQALRGVSQDIEAEVLRVVRSLPKWIPGSREGVAIPLEMRLPVRFKLE